MSSINTKFLVRIGNTTFFQVAVYVVIVIFIANLNAMVDAVLHPDIPYFDEEHLIVGGVTGLVCSILFGLLVLYAAKLQKALLTLKVLEDYLPICSGCNKIRKPGADSSHSESWQPLESYVMEKTNTRFSHGLCPQCLTRIYPEYSQDIYPDKDQVEDGITE